MPPGQKVQEFIQALISQTPEVRVLLDVGAQMLELKNQELAEAWLRVKKDAQAAVFVNDDDELVVVSRDGTVELLVSSPFTQQLDQCIVYLDDAHTRGTDLKLPSGFRAAVTLGPKVTKDRLTQEAWLRAKKDVRAAVFVNDDDELVVVNRDGTVEFLVSSPFAQQLDQCIVYLDDAHTRGTDLKLPSGFRAAVTLGPKVTKDRLMQGCMRMRKLGNGHSVMFFAPVEVDRSIRSAAQKAVSDDIDVADILHWTMRETCTDIQMRASHWIQQGLDFKRRHSAWDQFSPTLSTSISTLKTAWLQPEERTLEEMYAPRNSPQPSQILDPEIRRKCEELGVMSTSERSMDEEQEREVVHEVEREHQVERPPRVQPAAHVLHPDVRRFVETGQIPVGSSAFIQALPSLVNTTVEFPERYQWAQNVLVTRDFSRTVSTVHKADEYLRPVNWVVSSDIGLSLSPVLVVMSPDEVNKLLPSIRGSKLVHLCAYTPRTTKTMQACDLRFYGIPSTPQLTPLESLIFQLDLFAGQLYFSKYEMYLRTCRFLGLNGPDLGDEDLVVDSDGFIREENRPAARASCSFNQSQLLPLKKLFGMRRKGMGYLPTHLGKMLNGRILSEEDFRD
ncbi:hypothetical protein AZE42_09443 [Rhizopogon vesiculosus]|uniref:ubiquitinyl hydrolase 1 n=1 Tax=Rhizopogon vesiculosus TaxID=180088 RepID=A0A1J8Q7S8_9AGAM|nr:hypothetical protein AZE42_09443 [Rhizopogon vesiculosus]